MFASLIASTRRVLAAAGAGLVLVAAHWMQITTAVKFLEQERR